MALVSLVAPLILYGANLRNKRWMFKLILSSLLNSLGFTPFG